MWSGVWVVSTGGGTKKEQSTWAGGINTFSSPFRSSLPEPSSSLPRKLEGRGMTSVVSSLPTFFFFLPFFFFFFFVSSLT